MGNPTAPPGTQEEATTSPVNELGDISVNASHLGANDDHLEVPYLIDEEEKQGETKESQEGEGLADQVKADNQEDPELSLVESNTLEDSPPETSSIPKDPTDNPSSQEAQPSIQDPNPPSALNELTIQDIQDVQDSEQHDYTSLLSEYEAELLGRPSKEIVEMFIAEGRNAVVSLNQAVSLFK